MRCDGGHFGLKTYLGRLLIFHHVEFERHGVDAISFAGGWWAIIKNMPQMGIAAGTHDFFALHAKCIIDLNANIIGRYRVPETRPSGARLKFILIKEQIRATAHALINT